MNTTGDLKKRILLLLGDDIASSAGEEIFGGQYTSDSLLAGIHAALDAILPWVWKKSIFELNTSSDGYVFSLPADFYQVEGITPQTTYSSNGKEIDYATFSPMRTFRTRDSEVDYQYWTLYPEGKISFSVQIDLSAGGKMFYAASWTKPLQDATSLETPAYAITALSLYAASYCLLGKAVATANIRQYGTKVDSGTPEQNPLLAMSTYLQRMFEMAVQKLPVLPRGVIE